MKYIYIILRFALTFLPSHCFAQKLSEFTDTVYNLHISLPEGWQTTYNYGGRDTSRSVERIFCSELGSHSYYTEFISVLVGHVNDAHDFLYNRNSYCNSVYRIFTVKSVRKGRYYSEEFKMEHLKYDTIGADHYDRVDILGGMGKVDGRVMRTYFHFLCNNDVFMVAFSCPAPKFEYYKPLFLKIANSVYFE